MPKIALPFAAHHRELDARFCRLVELARADEQVELRTEWLLFQRELLDHMSLEDVQLLPLLEQNHSLEAAEIRRQHLRIRASLAELGTELDLHLLCADRVSEFVQALRDHAAREEGLLYRLSATSPTGSRLTAA